jgi:hypothetical protein
VVLKEGKLDLSSGKDKIEIAGDQPEMIYVAVEPYANRRARAAHRPLPLTPEAIPAATTDSTPWAPPSRREKSGSPRRAPTTSTRSGTVSWPPRQKSRSTPS